MENDDTWLRYQELVLSELKRMNQSIDLISQRTEKNMIDIELMKFKSSLFGSLSGLFTVGVVSLIDLIKH